MMFYLSTWQWERYKWKVDLVNSYRTNSEAQAIPFPLGGRSKEDFAEVINRKVKISGSYDFSRQMIVQNRRHASGPGFWLLTPFKIDRSESYVIVSRGFIPFADRTPEDWQKYNFKQEEEFEAVVQKTVDQMNFVAPKSKNNLSENSFTEKWLYPDMKEIAKQLPYPVITEVYLQRLGKPPVGTFPAEAISIQVPPSTHFGYTIEWALLGLMTLLIGFGLQAFGRRGKMRVLLIVAPYLFQVSPHQIAHAAETALQAEKATEITEHRGDKIDLELVFETQEGKKAKLRDLMNNRPFLLVPAYYRCPSLCSLTLTGVANLINDLELKLGSDYQILVYSINPKENYELADEKAKNYYKTLDSPELAKMTWNFLSTQDQATITKLSEQIGFGYKPDKDDFMHAALMVVVSPQGTISQYFYDINFPAKDVRLALIEASEGKIGSVLDRVVLYCFRFDPNHGKYTLAILGLTRIISLIVLALLIGGILFLKVKERKRSD